MNTEQISQEQVKQRIAIELENARIWGLFVLPGVGLTLSLFFTDYFFSPYPTARILLGTLVLLFTLFVVIMRAAHISKAHNLVEKL